MYAAGRGIDQMRATRAGGYAWRPMAAILVAVVAGFGFALIAHGGSPQPDSIYVVQPGDSLWSIAASHYPADDPRVKVDDIERANGLSGPIIEAGEALRLPG